MAQVAALAWARSMAQDLPNATGVAKKKKGGGERKRRNLKRRKKMMDR